MDTQTRGRGGQPGNINPRKGRMFADAISRALELPSRYEAKLRIDAIADKLVSMAEEGDIQAIRELGDRIDGKVAQAIIGDPENPLHMITEIRRKVVDGEDA